MTTMHDIYEQDLGGPKHENEDDCKAPAMSEKMREVIDQAHAGDTCVLTAIMNLLTWAYGTRFLPRGVDPDDYLETVAISFEASISEVESKLKSCLHKRPMN